MSKSFEELVEESDRQYQKQKAQYIDAYGMKSFNKWKAKIEREARIEGLMMARYVTAKDSREEKAIDVLIKSQELKN